MSLRHTSWQLHQFYDAIGMTSDLWASLDLSSSASYRMASPGCAGWGDY